MHLIPLDQIIQFNATMVDASYLSTIVLLSFAYHPSFSNILYLLYGSTSFGNPFHMLVRDSNTGSFIQNTTITPTYGCNIACEIKVTQNLLLIESESLIGIYPINSSFQITTNPIISSSKIGLTQSFNIHRWADINGPNFFVILDKNDCRFGEYDSSGLGYISSFNYQMSFNATDVLFAGLTQNRAYLAINSSSVVLIYYSCLPCAYNGSLVALGTGNTLVVPTGEYTTGAYRIYQGASITNPSFTDGIIYWAFSNGQSWKFLINATKFGLVENYNNYSAILATANHEYYLLVGSDQSVNFRSFEQAPKEDQYDLYSYSGYSAVSASVAIVRLSWDSAIVGVRTLTDSWKLQQFQLVEACQDYNATENSYNSFFCDCHSYDTDSRCSFIAIATNNSSSFPLTVVISVVASVAFLAISMVLIKKNYRNCIKGRQRTSYVYNPVELMSYEL